MRLPRDWLGPREELVPFGSPSEDSVSGAAVDEAPPDFWGETSASLHRPAVASLDMGEAAPSLRRPRRVGTAVRHRLAARRQLMPVLLVAALAIAAVAGVIRRPQASGVRAPSHPSLVTQRPGSTYVAPDPALRNYLSWAEHPSGEAKRTIARHASPARSAKRRSAKDGPSLVTSARSYSKPSTTPSGGGTSGTPVSYDATAASAGSGDNSSGGASSGSGGAGSGSGGGQSNPAPGPVGAGAPFGPGHLG